jgi:hypothetical protein
MLLMPQGTYMQKLRVGILLIDPWDLVTENGSHHSGIMTVIDRSGSLQGRSLRVQFDRPLSINQDALINLTVAEFLAQPRHRNERESFFGGHPVVFNLAVEMAHGQPRDGGEPHLVSIAVMKAIEPDV